ncbi:TPA: MFS transporter [Escherichia coli]|nr:MFS transporter [Escherichia coli]HAY3661094.1 MFS transporter [Escherichia coli]HCI2505927.1 MFS transporter [Escherichia coli]
MNITQKGRWAVTMLFFINGFVTGGWAVQIAQLVPRFGVTDKVIGHLILIFGFGALTMMPISGILMEKMGTQIVTRIFALAASLALIPVGLATTPLVLMPALFVLGAMIGAMNVAMNSNAVAVERSLSQAILSSCHCFWSIGLFAAGSIGGHLVEQFGFLTHIFLISAVALILTLIIAPAIFKDIQTVKSASRQTTRLPRSPAIYLIGLMAFLAMIPECAVVDWSSRYLIKNLNAKTEIASLAFACFAVAMALFRFMGDVIRNRFGAILIIRVSSLLAGASLLLSALAHNPWQAICAFTLAGIGIANLVPIVFSAAGNQPNISTNTGMSIATTIGYLGTLMAPAPIGYIAEITGFPVVYCGRAFMSGIIFLLAPLVRGAEISVQRQRASNKHQNTGAL